VLYYNVTTNLSYKWSAAVWKPLFALVLLVALPARAEPPVVAVSIQPLHSLVAAVMQGVGEPHLLVTGAQSEHTYALRPSDAKLLEKAGIVVLVDPGFESFLAKPLKRTKAEIVALADLPGIRRLPRREGGVWGGHQHDDDHDHGHDEGFDGHLWLDPANAKVLVDGVAERLAARDPANAARYRANARETTARVDALDAKLAATLAPVKGKPYVVFHDAWQYFEARYGLTPAGALTIDPDRPVSARRMAALRDRLKAAGTSCVFREPQFPSAVADSLAQSAGARVGVLDPQGADIPPGPGQYEALMTRMAESLAQCLSGR
jgi:zinc transport system substrate-binding protein